LHEAGDRDTFLELAAVADVVVENFRPGTMGRLGLSAETLRQVNPKLIIASLSGFGHTGSDTDRPAYDIIVQALSGLMSITGEGPGKAVRVGTSISDILTGLYGAIAIVAALHHRDRTAEGSTIDLAMLDCAVAALENAVSRHGVTGEVPEPLGTRHPSITPFQAFETKDGALVIAAGNDALWRKLCVALDRPELSDDYRLKTNAARTENHGYLEECLAPCLRQKARVEWLQLFAAAGVPAAPIRNIAEVVADEHLSSRDMLHEMRDAAGATFITAGSPLRMNDCSVPLSRRAPELGEDSKSVLAEWINQVR
ncbi:MAG: CoA transferase, partial [Pirellulales bacterium]